MSPLKKFIAYITVSFFLLLQACSQQNNIIQGQLYNRIQLKNDTTLSYAIYIPKKVSVQHPLAFIFFDPHGSGMLPVTLYKNLADEFGVMLIGNNNSSNGLDFNLISSNFSTLLNELKSTYKIDEKDIALWGFSGGAKAAMYNAGFNNAISYCIYGGSVMNPQNKNTELLGFNGKQDMNYTDLLGFVSLQQANTKHFQIEFTGKHAWPDTITAKDAFRWLLLKKMQKKELITNKVFVQKTISIYKKQVDNLVLTKQYPDAFLTCNKAINFLNSLTDITYFKEKKTSLLALPLFKKQVEGLQTSFETETKLKIQYQHDFLEKDTIYWKKEIDKLWNISKTDKSGIYSRLLGFLSLASYSYANHAFQENNIKELEQILFIYQHSDPTNPEQAFMRAELYVQKDEIENAKAALQEAVKLGIDKSRISSNALLKDL